MIDYLSTEDVIALHARAVRATGGRPEGIRDRGGLESAVMRPRFLAHYAAADLVAQTAALATGLSRAQAFVDGNKRVAYLAARVFLERNGFEFVGNPLDLARQLEHAAAPDVPDVDADTSLAEWLRAHSKPLP